MYEIIATAKSIRARPSEVPVSEYADRVLRDLAKRISARFDSSAGPSFIAADEEVFLFPTFASRRADGSILIRLHGWIGRPERASRKRNLLLDAVSSALGLHDAARFAENAAEVFRERARPFLADNKRGKRIGLDSPFGRFVLPRTAANGLFAADIVLPNGVPWAPGTGAAFRVVMPAADTRRFSLEIPLLADQGVSIVSDIDDTLKISQVADRRTLLRHTFVLPHEPCPGMPAFLRSLASTAAASTHYVSAAPWQLYGSIAEFLKGHEYPAGSVHLRGIRFKDRSIFELFREPTEHKATIIRRLFARLPHRRFILIGDSSERDPEIYAALATEHPGRIDHVYIRDVTGEAMTANRYRRSLWAVLDGRWSLFTDPSGLMPAS